MVWASVLEVIQTMTESWFEIITLIHKSKVSYMEELFKSGQILGRSEMKKIMAGSGECDPYEECDTSSCSRDKLACCCCENGSWVFKKCVSSNMECYQDCS